jgi:putative intracellular protease/amidase
MNTAVLLFDDIQIIDFTGPWEAFGRRGTVYGVSETGEAILTSMGMRVVPSYSIAAAPPPDILVVPGGGNSGEPGSTPYGVGAQLELPAVIEWIRATAERASAVLSVCNGAFLVQRAGLLDGKSATTTASYLDYLASVAPATHVVPDRVVDNGKVITAGGLSSGIDGALHVIERLEGHGAAMQVALGMEYDWDPGNGFSRAQLADFQIPGGLYAPFAAGAVLVDMHSSPTEADEVYRVPSTMSPAAMAAAIDATWESLGWDRLAAGSGRGTGADGRTWEIATSAAADASGSSLLVALRIRQA